MRGILFISHREALHDQKFPAAFLALGAQQEGVVCKVSSGDSDFLMTVRALHRLTYRVRSAASRRALLAGTVKSCSSQLH